MSARIDGKMDGVLRHLRRCPIARRLRYPQIETHRRQTQAARLEHFASTLENRAGWFHERDPKRNQPTIPKVGPASLVGYPRARAGECRHENRSIGAAEVERNIDSLAANFSKHRPLLA